MCSQASDAVEEARKILAEKEDKLLMAKKRFAAEAKERQSKLSIARSKVKRARYCTLYIYKYTCIHEHALSLPTFFMTLYIHVHVLNTKLEFAC